MCIRICIHACISISTVYCENLHTDSLREAVGPAMTFTLSPKPTQSVALPDVPDSAAFPESSASVGSGSKASDFVLLQKPKPYTPYVYTNP